MLLAPKLIRKGFETCHVSKLWTKRCVKPLFSKSLFPLGAADLISLLLLQLAADTSEKTVERGLSLTEEARMEFQHPDLSLVQLQPLQSVQPFVE